MQHVHFLMQWKHCGAEDTDRQDGAGYFWYMKKSQPCSCFAVISLWYFFVKHQHLLAQYFLVKLFCVKQKSNCEHRMWRNGKTPLNHTLLTHTHTQPDINHRRPVIDASLCRTCLSTQQIKPQLCTDNNSDHCRF